MTHSVVHNNFRVVESSILTLRNITFNCLKSQMLGGNMMTSPCDTSVLVWFYVSKNFRFCLDSLSGVANIFNFEF